jgi:hypothetical protein
MACTIRSRIGFLKEEAMRSGNTNRVLFCLRDPSIRASAERRCIKPRPVQNAVNSVSSGIS